MVRREESRSNMKTIIDPKDREKASTTEQGAASIQKEEVSRETIESATKVEMVSEVLDIKKEVIKTELDITPAEFKAAEYKAAEYKAAEFKAAEFKPATFEQAKYKEATYKPAEFKAAEYRPAEFKQGSYRPAEFKQATFKPAEFKQAEFKPAAFKPAEFKQAEYKAAEYKAAEFKPAEFKPAEYKAAEYTPAEYKAAEYKAADYRPAQYEAADFKPATFGQAQYKPAEFKPADYKAAEFKQAEFKQAEIEGKRIEERPVEVLRTATPHLVESHRALEAVEAAKTAAMAEKAAPASWSAAEVDRLNAYWRQEMSAVRTYDMTLERTRDPNVRRTLVELRDNHQRREAALRQALGAGAEESAKTSTVWNAIARLLQRGAELLGDRGASALLEEEQNELDVYLHDETIGGARFAEFLHTNLVPEQRKTQELCRSLSRPMRAA
jgi:uncharacterized protein YjbI with pentapeptide repeats